MSRSWKVPSNCTSVRRVSVERPRSPTSTRYSRKGDSRIAAQFSFDCGNYFGGLRSSGNGQTHDRRKCGQRPQTPVAHSLPPFYLFLRLGAVGVDKSAYRIRIRETRRQGQSKVFMAAIRTARRGAVPNRMIGWQLENEMTIFSIGEILWDVFPDTVRLGGAPFNFAVHAHRLGHRVIFLSAVGDDERGRAALARAAALGPGDRVHPGGGPADGKRIRAPGCGRASRLHDSPARGLRLPVACRIAATAAGGTPTGLDLFRDLVCNGRPRPRRAAPVDGCRAARAAFLRREFAARLLYAGTGSRICSPWPMR